MSNYACFKKYEKILKKGKDLSIFYNKFEISIKLGIK